MYEEIVLLVLAPIWAVRGEIPSWKEGTDGCPCEKKP